MTTIGFWGWFHGGRKGAAPVLDAEAAAAVLEEAEVAAAAGWALGDVLAAVEACRAGEAQAA
jgi:hypothetical protein